MPREAPEELADVGDAIVAKVAAAVRTDNLARLDRELDLLQRLYIDSLAMLERLTSQEPTLQPTMFGWRPLAIWNVLVARIGSIVIADGSRPMMSRWLYFPQELLQLSRHSRKRRTLDIMQIWVRAGTELPQLSEDFWQRLHEYSMEISSVAKNATTTDELLDVTSELIGMLQTLRHMVVNFQAAAFVRLARLSDEVGKYLDYGWIDQLLPPQVEEVDRARIHLAQLLADLKRQLWLGYAGHLLRTHDEAAATDSADLAEQWRFILGQFPAFPDIWRAWKAMREDTFQWAHELLVRQQRQEQRLGQPVFSGSVDIYAGTTEAFLLLACHLVSDVALPANEEDTDLFSGWLSPAIAQLTNPQQQPPPFAAPWSPEDLKRRLGDVTSRLREAAHAGEALRMRRVAETPLDDERVAAIFDILFRPLLTADPCISRIAADAGRLQPVSSRRGTVPIRIDLAVARDSFIADGIDIYLGQPFLLERENSIILAEAARRVASVEVETADAFVTELHRAIESLRRRGRPPSHVFLSPTFQVVQAIRSSPYFHPPSDDELRGTWLLGDWEGVPVFGGGLSMPRNLALIACLPDWLELDYVDPTPPVSRHIPRFTAVLRPATDEEIKARAESIELLSQVGLPFEAADQQWARLNYMTLHIEEMVRVRVLHRNAARIVSLRSALANA